MRSEVSLCSLGSLSLAASGAANGRRSPRDAPGRVCQAGWDVREGSAHSGQEPPSSGASAGLAVSKMMLLGGWGHGEGRSSPRAQPGPPGRSWVLTVSLTHGRPCGLLRLCLQDKCLEVWECVGEWGPHLQRGLAPQDHRELGFFTASLGSGLSGPPLSTGSLGGRAATPTGTVALVPLLPWNLPEVLRRKGWSEECWGCPHGGRGLPEEGAVRPRGGGCCRCENTPWGLGRRASCPLPWAAVSGLSGTGTRGRRASVSREGSLCHAECCFGPGQ